MRKTIWVVISLLFTILKLSIDLGIIRQIQLGKSYFYAGTFHYKSYNLTQKEISGAFSELNSVYQKFNLEKEFYLMGIYYEYSENYDPEKKMKACLGFFRKAELPQYQNKDLDHYLNQAGFKIKELPKTKSIFADWTYPIFFSFIIGVGKFYSELKSSLGNKSFRRIIGMAPEDKVSFTIELYENKEVVLFYVPVENQKEFLVHENIK